MAGTRVNANPVRHVINGSSEAAVTAGQVLRRWVAPFGGRIHAVKANAATAAVGAGNTVLTVKKNGTAIWTTDANRPTLATASTGEFTNVSPDVKAFVPGDLFTLEVVSIPATSGHVGVCMSVAVGIG